MPRFNKIGPDAENLLAASMLGMSFDTDTPGMDVKTIAKRISNELDRMGWALELTPAPDVLKRVDRGIARLQEKMDAPGTSYGEKRRLADKIEGMRLVRSYMDDYS